MSRVVRTYQQNFISSTASDSWFFTFAPVPRKAKNSNRFKISVSYLSAYISQTTGANVFVPQAFFARGLQNSISNTGAGDVVTTQVTGDTLLGIVGNAFDVNTITGSTTKYANSIVGTPYYFYLAEMPTQSFFIYYTPITTYTYGDVNDLQFLLSFLIEEVDDEP